MMSHDAVKREADEWAKQRMTKLDKSYIYCPRYYLVRSLLLGIYAIDVYNSASNIVEYVTECPKSVSTHGASSSKAHATNTDSNW